MNKLISKVVSLAAVLSVIVPATFAPLTAFAATTATLATVTNGTHTAWLGNEADVDEPDSTNCSVGSVIVSFGVGSRESYTLDLSSIPDGSTITSVDITVRDRGAILAGGTYQTFTILDGGTPLDSAVSLTATGGLVADCSSPKTQTLDVSDTVKSGATTLEIGVVKTGGTAVTNRIVHIGAMTAVVTYTEADTDGDGVVDSTDNCVETPNADQADFDADNIGDVCEATGSIDITKYACPADTELLRSVNGVGGTVPAGCTLSSGAYFGYVHGSGVGAGGPYDDVLGGGVTHEIGGVTGEDGEITISGLAATGRYLVYETNSDYVQLPNSEILNLYCEGDGETVDAASDNQELTFVPEGGVTQCVAYNAAPVEICAEDSFAVVSDEAHNFVDEHAAVAVATHPAWATIPGATWIWSAALDEAGSSPVGTKEFRSFFTITDTPQDSQIEIAADNGYSVTVNGNFVCASSGDTNYSPTATCPIPAASLIEGSNQLDITATNAPAPEGYDGANPAGLLYKLSVTAGSCDEEEGGGGGSEVPGDISAIIQIVKKTFGAFGTFDFTLSGAGVDEDDAMFDITTPNGEGTPEDYTATVYPSDFNDEYTITEDVPAGWDMVVVCSEDTDWVTEIENGVIITVDPSDTPTCYFENTATAGAITIIKQVINDNGESLAADDFTIEVKRDAEVLTTVAGNEEGTIALISAGTYSVVEQPNHNYETTYSEECTGTIALGEHKTCTVTNNDITSDNGSSSSGSVANEDQGSVLGASTETTTGSVLGALICSDLSYDQLITIKDGTGADSEIVKALQEWLNSHENAGLTVTGVYDAATKFAVMLFQEKHADEILKPWGLEKATGNVWKTTAALIMKLVCGTQVEIGALIPFTPTSA